MKEPNGHVNEKFRVVDLIDGLLFSGFEEISIVTQFPCIASLGENLAEFFIDKSWLDEMLAKETNDARMFFGLQSFTGKQSGGSSKNGIVRFR